MRTLCATRAAVSSHSRSRRSTISACRSIGSVWHKFPGEGGVTGLDRTDRIASRLSHVSRTRHRDIQSLLLPHSAGMGLGSESETELLRASSVSVTKIERGDEISDRNLKFQSQI